MADGIPVWYSSAESELKPSSPISSSAYSAAVRLAVLGVPLGRDVAHGAVVGHYRLPRFSCSRSIASNRAWKLPLPKPREPCRSMNSKNTVGRSPTGLPKICSR